MDTREPDNSVETGGDMDEIWTMFSEESVEHLENIEDCLLSLEENSTDAEKIDSLFRSIHTVKGMARMLGLERLGNFVHRAEDVVGLVRDQGVAFDGEISDLLFEALDEIRSMVTGAVETREDPAMEHSKINERLEALYEQRQGDEVAQPAISCSDEAVNHKSPASIASGSMEEPCGSCALKDEPAEEFFKVEQHEDEQGLHEQGPGDEIDVPSTQGGIHLTDQDSEVDHHAGGDSDDAQASCVNDPEQLSAFIFLAEEEYPGFLQSISGCMSDSAALSEVAEAVEILSLAAEQMGFLQLQDLFEEIGKIAGRAGDNESCESEVKRIYSLAQETLECLKDIYKMAEAAGAHDGVFPFVLPEAMPAVSRYEGCAEHASDDEPEETATSPVESYEPGTECHAARDPESESPCNETNFSPDGLQASYSQEGDAAQELNQDFSDMHEEQEVIAIDPATDPESIRAFLFLIQEEFPKLRAAMEQVVSGRDRLDELRESVETISFAAGQMGYQLLKQAVDDLLDAGKLPSKERAELLEELGARLYDELNAVYNMAKEMGVETTLSQSDLSSLFIQRLNGDALAETARLGEAALGLRNFIEVMDAGGGNLSDTDRQCAEIAIESLRNLYHYCSFYELEPAARLAILLEDLFSRLYSGIISVSPELADITLQFQQELQKAFEADREGRQYSPAVISKLASRASDVISIQEDNRIAKVSRRILDLLDISPGLREVVTAENLHDIACFVRDGSLFYEVRADIDSDPDIAEKFLSWTDQVTFITNETLYEDNRSLYNFLLATSLTPEEMEEGIRNIDPSASFLTVRQCVVSEEGVSGDLFSTSEDTGHVFSEGDQSVQRQENLNRLLSGIEDITEARSMLHYVVEVLSDIDMQEYMDRLGRESVEGEILNNLFATLTQADGQMGIALGRIQESARELKTGRADVVLRHMEKTVRDINAFGNYGVCLRKRGGDVCIDSDILTALSEPLSRLAWFCTKKVAGDRKLRVNKGMSASADLEVYVTRSGDHVMVTVSVDGPGSSDAQIMDAAMELACDLEESLSTHRCRVRVESGKQSVLKFVLYFPFINAIMDAMVVRKGEVRYAIPIKAIQRILKPEKSDIAMASADGSKVLRLEDNLVPIIGLHDDRTLHEGQCGATCSLLVVVENQDTSLAMPVDELVGQQQVMMKPLSGALAGISGAAGCAILGGGEVGLVMDVNALGRA